MREGRSCWFRWWRWRKRSWGSSYFCFGRNTNKFEQFQHERTLRWLSWSCSRNVISPWQSYIQNKEKRPKIFLVFLISISTNFLNEGWDIPNKNIWFISNTNLITNTILINKKNRCFHFNLPTLKHNSSDQIENLSTVGKKKKNWKSASDSFLHNEVRQTYLSSVLSFNITTTEIK